MSPRYSLIMIIAIAVMVTTSTLQLSSNSCAGPVVATYFYVWYGEGRHWDSTVIDAPIWGNYSSGNESIIIKQLRLIRDAGIDALFISWWGPGSYEDRVAKKVFSYLPRFGLRAAILLEPYLGNDPYKYDKEWWSGVLAYVKQNFIDAYPDTYFYLDGRPLILAFNPIGMSYEPRRDFPEYSIRIVGNDIDNAKYQDWDLWPDYDTGLSGNLRIRKDGYVAIAPRFDDEHFRPGGVPQYDPDLTQGWYQKQWEWILRNKDRVGIIAIYSWNEYHERSMIEPHSDATAAKDPYYLLNLTREYIAKAKHSANDGEWETPVTVAAALTGAAVITILARKQKHKKQSAQATNMPQHRLARDRASTTSSFLFRHVSRGKYQDNSDQPYKHHKTRRALTSVLSKDLMKWEHKPEQNEADTDPKEVETQPNNSPIKRSHCFILKMNDRADRSKAPVLLSMREQRLGTISWYLSRLDPPMLRRLSLIVALLWYTLGSLLS